MKTMKKKYCKPKIKPIELADAVLGVASDVSVGGYGQFDAKRSYLYFNDEEDEYE